ncbi:unnamed protein product [Closterium sp. Naga37s-1]|nr:unnamed protein product [Closterium sp. Naga37s-1]
MAASNAALAILVLVFAAAGATRAMDLHREARMEELKASIRDRRPSFIFVKLRHDAGSRTLVRPAHDPPRLDFAIPITPESDATDPSLPISHLSGFRWPCHMRDVRYPLIPVSPLSVSLSVPPFGSQEDVQQLATRWQAGMTEGKIAANVYPLDSDTLHIALLTTAAASKVKEFVLEQEEAYELLVGDDVVRRPGDQPLESLVHRDVWKREKMRQEMMKEREKLHLDRMGGDGGMTDHHRQRIKEQLRARHVDRLERKRKMREEWLENHADDDL